MTAKDKAITLIAQYKVILMAEDTDCGCEILCTTIAKKSSLIAVEEIISTCEWYDKRYKSNMLTYWNEVKKEINEL